MQILRGKQQNTVRYFHNGYVYYNDRRGHGTIFRCQLKNTQQCRAVAYVNSLDDLETQPVTVEGIHHHAADHFIPLREKFTDEIEEQALTWDDPKEIFDRVRAKEEYRAIANEVSFYTEYKQKIEAVRKKHVPPTPKDLAELGDMLQEYPPLRHLYQGTINGEDGSTGVVLMNEAMREPLSACKQLYADGTFKVRLIDYKNLVLGNHTVKLLTFL